MCATACAPSTRTGCRAGARGATISATGLTVPSAFETWATDTIRVRSVSSVVRVEIKLAGVGDRHDASRAPCCSQRICHGTMFEWCSIAVTSDFVAGADVRAPQGRGDQVDGLGGAAHEDDLLALRALRKRADRLAAPS